LELFCRGVVPIPKLGRCRTAPAAATRAAGATIRPHEDDMPEKLTKRGKPDRSKIAMHEDHEVHYWTKHLGITRDELQRVVDKVGNSAAAVRKELGNKK
jgi:hypothetical protein